MASAVSRSWLTSTETRVRHWLDPQGGTVRAANTEHYGAIPLAETPAAPDPAEAARLMSEAFLARGLFREDEQLVRRLAFAGVEHDVRELAERAAVLAPSLCEMKLQNALDYAARRGLDTLAPEWIDVPSGRRAGLEYQSDGTVLASVKLQELFGLAETPRIGRDRVPVTFALLAPNGRPVQMTRDLRSFWERTYPEVRRELRGRYPKHPWPENPWTAVPTARTSRRRKNGV